MNTWPYEIEYDNVDGPRPSLLFIDPDGKHSDELGEEYDDAPVTPRIDAVGIKQRAMRYSPREGLCSIMILLLFPIRHGGVFPGLGAVALSLLSKLLRPKI